MDYKEELKACHDRIKPYIHKTPVLTSSYLNDRGSCEIYFKCEQFQKMGAFKMRGAANAILSLTEHEMKNGVVTHSSGNFAQAVSLSAKSIGVPAYIVMPENAPNVKKDAVRSYNGQITECYPSIEVRQATADKIVEDTGASFLHPSNQIEVILGQGTAALELLDDYPDLDLIVTPVGGGGLVAGTALACHYFSKKCKTIGAEPSKVDDAYRSLKSGKIENNETTDTIADGLRTTLGDVNFPLIQKYVDQILLADEDEIIEAMKLIWERMKIIIEPSCALPLAVVLKNPDLFSHKKVGIILSGGNVDLKKLPF